ESGCLRHIAYATPHLVWTIGHVETGHDGSPGRCARERCQNSDGGGLPGAVRAENTEDLTRHYLQRYSGERLYARRVRLRHLVQIDAWLHLDQTVLVTRDPGGPNRGCVEMTAIKGHASRALLDVATILPSSADLHASVKSEITRNLRTLSTLPSPQPVDALDVKVWMRCAVTCALHVTWTHSRMNREVCFSLARQAVANLT